MNRHLRFLFHLFYPCRPPLPPPPWANFSGPVNRHTLTSSSLKVSSLKLIPVLSYITGKSKKSFSLSKFYLLFFISIGHRTEVIKKGPDKGTKKCVCELPNRFILKLGLTDVAVSRLLPNHIVRYQSCAFVFCPIFHGLGVTARSFPDVTICDSAICFYFFIILPNSDTFLVCSFIGTETRTEFCPARLL